MKRCKCKNWMIDRGECLFFEIPYERYSECDEYRPRDNWLVRLKEWLGRKKSS